MENIELQNIWKSYDQKLESMLAIHKDIAVNISRQKLNKQISRLYRPKFTAIVIGVPYTLLLIAVTIVAYTAKAYVATVGFGAISMLMILLLWHYLYQLYLIGRVRNDDEVLSTQQQLSKLRISVYRSLNLAVFQLPFWAICWVSISALKESPIIYGGLNLLIFIILSYLSYWLYQKLNSKNQISKVRNFFLSGSDWEPIVRSAEILEQIKEYQK